MPGRRRRRAVDHGTSSGNDEGDPDEHKALEGRNANAVLTVLDNNSPYEKQLREMGGMIYALCRGRPNVDEVLRVACGGRCSTCNILQLRSVDIDAFQRNIVCHSR